MSFLSQQVIELSHHIGNTKCTHLLGIFYLLAKFAFWECSLGSRERHLIVYMIVDSKTSPCSMYVREDDLL